VDSQPYAGSLPHLTHDLEHPVRQHAAVGIAQDSDRCASTEGDLENAHAVIPVVRETIEEVLQVEEHTPVMLDEVAHGVGNHREVLFIRRPQRLRHVAHIRLGYQGDHRGLRIQKCLDLRIVLNRDARFTGRTERDKLRRLQVEFIARPGEELGVLRHGPGPTALDEAHAIAIQQPGNRQLVGHGVRDAFALGTIAQRGVVDVEAVAKGQRGHGPSSSKKPPAGAKGCASMPQGGADALGNDDAGVKHGAESSPRVRDAAGPRSR